MSCESTNWDSNKKLSEEVKINYLITKRRYDKIVELEEDLGTYQEENSVLRAQLQKQVDGLNREIPKNPDIMNREALIVRMKNLRNLINQSK